MENEAMKSIDDEINPRRVRTTTALVFLAAFAMILSWLAVYAVPNALVAADLMRPWSQGNDPRPIWLLNTFVGLFVTFGGLGLLFTWASHRQLKRIDAMADAEDVLP